jgi:hypothetical protein
MKSTDPKKLGISKIVDSVLNIKTGFMDSSIALRREGGQEEKEKSELG